VRRCAREHGARDQGDSLQAFGIHCSPPQEDGMRASMLDHEPLPYPPKYSVAAPSACCMQRRPCGRRSHLLSVSSNATFRRRPP
jgi:hypothetical protein